MELWKGRASTETAQITLLCGRTIGKAEYELRNQEGTTERPKSSRKCYARVNQL